MLRELKKDPHRIVGMTVTFDNDEILLLTDRGQVEKVAVSSLSCSDRYSNGSFIIDVAESGKVEKLWRLNKEDIE